MAELRGDPAALLPAAGVLTTIRMARTVDLRCPACGQTTSVAVASLLRAAGVLAGEPAGERLRVE